LRLHVAGWPVVWGYSWLRGATPGQFFSFLTAFLLATSRPNACAATSVEQQSGRPRCSEVVDRPASELSDDTNRRLNIDPGIELRDVSLPTVRTSRYSTAWFCCGARKVTRWSPFRGGNRRVLALLLACHMTQPMATSYDGQASAVSADRFARQPALSGRTSICFPPDTIRENIASASKCDEADIVPPAKAACAHEFINAVFRSVYDHTRPICPPPEGPTSR